MSMQDIESRIGVRVSALSSDEQLFDDKMLAVAEAVPYRIELQTDLNIHDALICAVRVASNYIEDVGISTESTCCNSFIHHQ